MWSGLEADQAGNTVARRCPFGALLVILFINVQFALDFQLIGGIIITQILPAVVFGLYTGWFHRWALLIGWLAGIAISFWMLWYVPNPATHHKHFGGTQWGLSHIGIDTKSAIWIGIPTVLINMLLAAALTPMFAKLPRGIDQTDESDYHAEAGDPAVGAMPLSPGQEAVTT